MKAQIAEFGKDYRTGMWRVTFSLFGDFRQAYDELHEGFVDLTVKKYRKKRSKNANAYCWELIGQLADKLDIPPLEIYRDAIREVGVYQDVEIAPKAAETFAHIWRQHGLGWVCEKLDEMSGPNDMIVMRFLVRLQFLQHEADEQTDRLHCHRVPGTGNRDGHPGRTQPVS